jgi:hypothetical protein
MMFDTEMPRRRLVNPGLADRRGVDMTGRICIVDDCPRTDVVGYDGLCRKHYERKRKTGTTELRQRPRLICSVETCGEPVRTMKLCGTHYSRLLKVGDVQADVPIRKLRELGASKPCSTCDIVKPLNDFAPDNRHRDGRQARCRECVKAYQKRYRQDNRERYRELKKAEAERSKSTTRAWREANRNHIAEQRRAWAASLSEERREAMHEYHRKRSTEYREKNQNLCNERIRRWKKASPERILDDVNRRRAGSMETETLNGSPGLKLASVTAGSVASVRSRSTRPSASPTSSLRRWTTSSRSH